MDAEKTKQIVDQLKAHVALEHQKMTEIYDTKLAQLPPITQGRFSEFLKWYGADVLICEQKVVMLYHLKNQVEKLEDVPSILGAVARKQVEIFQSVVDDTAMGSGAALDNAIREARQTAMARLATRDLPFLLANLEATVNKFHKAKAQAEAAKA